MIKTLFDRNFFLQYRLSGEIQEISVFLLFSKSSLREHLSNAFFDSIMIYTGENEQANKVDSRETQRVTSSNITEVMCKTL